MKLKPWAAALVALATGLAITGCGSSKKGSDAAADGGLKGDPVKVGLICSCSGPFASSLGSLPDLAKAWSTYLNNKGGINGAPVEVVVADDGADATKSQQLVRKLVEQDKVLAIVDETASFDATWADYVTKKAIPVTGGVSFTVPMTSNANFFPAGGNLAAVTYGLVKLMEDAGKKKLALMPCAEAPLCDGYGGQISRISDVLGAGIDIVYQSKVAATAASYTSLCLAAKKAGADAMYVGHAGQVVERIVNECVLQGFKPKQFQVGGDVVSSWSKNPNMDGVPIAQLHLPMHDTSTKGGKDFADAIAKYAPELPNGTSWAGSVLETWTGLQLFAAAANEAKVTANSTGADVKKGLYAIAGTTLDGLTPPLHYVEGKPTLINCYFNESVEGGKWTTPGGAAPVCLDDATAEKVNKAFAG
ncbi:ABC transporter substrate-binding protein [Dactylosporangium sp. CA-233914]|uniref:ABC transporter substrate-binding protein n=1 Tax=Dactylosporangium sp. CA-233914 TaxID=3239934 RepID=UPI003D8C3C6A